jgi:hypothetical protein
MLLLYEKNGTMQINVIIVWKENVMHKLLFSLNTKIYILIGKKVQMILYSQFKINYHKKLEERKSPTTKR